MNESLKSLAKVTPADLAIFKLTRKLTNAKMCAIFGISTQAKYNKMVKEEAPYGSKDLDLSYAFLYRLYEAHPEFIPMSNKLTVSECFEMFRGVLGEKYMNVSTFGEIMGRSAGSGYRWIRSQGMSTPQVELILDRFAAMRSAGWTDEAICHFWIELVRGEFAARGKVFPFDRIDDQIEKRKKSSVRGRQPGASAAVAKALAERVAELNKKLQSAGADSSGASKPAKKTTRKVAKQSVAAVVSEVQPAVSSKTKKSASVTRSAKTKVSSVASKATEKQTKPAGRAAKTAIKPSAKAGKSVGTKAS